MNDPAVPEKFKNTLIGFFYSYNCVLRYIGLYFAEGDTNANDDLNLLFFIDRIYKTKKKYNYIL